MFRLFVKSEPIATTFIIEDLSGQIIAVLDQNYLGQLNVYSLTEAENFLIDIGLFYDLEDLEGCKTEDQKHKVYYIN